MMIVLLTFIAVLIIITTLLLVCNRLGSLATLYFTMSVFTIGYSLLSFSVVWPIMYIGLHLAVYSFIIHLLIKKG